MLRRKKYVQSILGILFGLFVSQLLKEYTAIPRLESCRFYPRSPPKKDPLAIIGILPNETISNSERTLLFVGVMTARKYLDTRAKAVYETWGSEVPGSIAFFSSEDSYSDEIPLVALRGIDDRYPPQRKSFTMLKYIYDNYGDKFEWFLRADDDVYIRTDRLEELLRSVDSRKPWFIGQAGRGNSEEFGLLSLDHDENFCMGGPGVIMSRETLRRIAPHLNTCMENLVTTHEDVELGRCVRKFAGIQCTWSYEMQTILYHNQSGDMAFTGNLKQKEVHRAITMHPIKQPSHMYRLHKYVKGLKIQETEHETVLLYRDVAVCAGELNLTVSEDADLVDGVRLFPGVPRGADLYAYPQTLGTKPGLNRYKPKTVRDILDWELILSKTVYSYRDANPRHRITSSVKEGVDDVVREVMTTINMYSKQRGRVIDFRELLYGYWRYDPLHGADMILDMLLTYRKYRGHKMTVPVRRHAYLQQTFTGIYIREVNYTDRCGETRTSPRTPKSRNDGKLLHHLHDALHEGISKLGKNIQKLKLFTDDTDSNPRNRRIHFVLPLSGRYETFKRFMTIYENVCLKANENTRLIVVLYNDGVDYDNILRLLADTQDKYNSDITVIKMPGQFSRGPALQKGAERCSDDDLMFFIDVDIIFNKEALQRIRFNTIKDEQIYFPIVFSQYDPGFVYGKHLNGIEIQKPADDFNINLENGFWRQFGFGIVSLFNSDFRKLKGFDTNITGWGFEDVQFYEKMLKANMKFIRSPDPGLVHVFHSIDCDRLEGNQKEMCSGTKASLLGSYKQLERFLLRHPDIMRRNRGGPG